jgi:glutamyl-tRNA reductase
MIYRLFPNQHLYEKHAYHFCNHRAVKHLFEVAGGLDAQILGDFEILGQVKNALKKSQQFQMATGSLTRLVEFAISSSKAIKTFTSLSSGASSVASAAVVYLQNHIDTLQHKKVLLVGAGKIGSTTCNNLIKQVLPTNITVINRTYEKALQTANKFGLQVDKYENLDALIQQNDIVIVATGAPVPVITTENFTHVNAEEKICLDLSVPRNIDATVSTLPGITVVNIDQLEDLKNASIEQRKLSVPKAKQIIHEHILEYNSWLHTTPAFPTIEKISKQIHKVDLTLIADKLRTAGVLPLHEKGTSQDKLLKFCIKHLKENYHKSEVYDWYQETFGLHEFLLRKEVVTL